MGEILKKVLILGLLGLLLGCSSGKQTIRATFVDNIAKPENNPKFRQGLESYQNKQYQKAERLLSEYLETDPDHWQANYYLGLICIENLQYAKSEDYLFKALDLVDQSKDNRAQVYFTLGRLYECLQNLASAKLNYLTAYRLNPDSLPIQKAAKKYQLISSTK